MKKNMLVYCFLAFVPMAVLAGNAWGPYHWASTTYPEEFDVTLVNSTTGDWDAYVAQAVADWNDSLVMDMVQAPGSIEDKVRRQCKAPAGQISICNLAYGQNGWLGIAGISIDADDHIISGYTKLNDTYFSRDYYNQNNWKQSVTCQELGHNLGLGHQDEDFGNESLYSCMDYQDPPFELPNAHDYDQLDLIYNHADGYNSYTSGDSNAEPDGGGKGCPPHARGCNKGEINGHHGDIGWGVSLGRRGQQETFLRIDPDGTRHLTHVTWAEGH